MIREICEVEGFWKTEATGKTILEGVEALFKGEKEELREVLKGGE